MADQSDPLLIPFMQASNEDEVDRLLGQILTETAQPIVSGIVRTYIAGSSFYSESDQLSEDIQNLIADATVQILKRLRQIRLKPELGTIGSFKGYVSVTAYNTCHRHLRMKYPQRARLKHKVRYILTHKKGFSLWKDDQENWLGGITEWVESRKSPVSRGRINQLRNDSQALEQAGLSPDRIDYSDPIEVVTAILRWGDGPIEIDDLVSLTAELCRIRDYPPQTESETDLSSLPDHRQRDSLGEATSKAEQRLYLERLWKEICQLPLEQRSALLLNLRDPHESSMITLLSDIGIATVREVASALTLPVERFARLWNELPLDDSTIAQHLQVTRQQVINFRVSARRRLSRRMKALGKPF
jgi:DNA-directed RNA polymerase specialized sigma24 family protein